MNPSDLVSELVEACQVALMNLEANTKPHEYQLTKLKLERALRLAGAPKLDNPLLAQIRAVAATSKVINRFFGEIP